MLLDDSFFERFGVEYSPNEIIFCEFEPGYEFYFLQQGKVKIVKIINNREKTIDVLTDGDVFGEIALLQNVPRSATVVSETPSELWRLDRDAFLYAVTGTPDCYHAISSVAQQRLRRASPGRTRRA